MTEKRIEKWFDGTLHPNSIDPPQLSSTRTPWSGFLVEGGPCPGGEASRIVWPHTELIMVTEGGIWVEDHAFGARKRFFAEPGSITIWPTAHESKSASWWPLDPSHGTTRMMNVQLDPSVLEPLLPEIEGRELAMQPALQDPNLASLLRLIKAEVQAGCATGRLYGESLCLALATCVLERYSAVPKQERPARASLSVRQRERVREYVHENLDGDLSLAELARVAALSPQHFTVACRSTFGATPHQYILRERINRARRLLATQGCLSIADIAFTVGFATQSHFTAAFKRSVGVTPRHYRITC